jgi:hypothetical protein
VAPIGADEVPVLEARCARRLVQLAAVAALLPRPVVPGSGAFVAALSRHLGVRDSAVQVVQALAR